SGPIKMDRAISVPAFGTVAPGKNGEEPEWTIIAMAKAIRYDSANGRSPNGSRCRGQPIAVAGFDQRRPGVAAIEGGGKAIAVADRDDQRVPGMLPGAFVLALPAGARICGLVSRIGNGLDGAASVSALRVFIRAVAAEQPGHQLHQFFSQPRGELFAVDADTGADGVSVEISGIHAAGVLGVSVLDRAAAGGLRPDAACAVGFLPGDAWIRGDVHRAAGSGGGVVCIEPGAVPGSARVPGGGLPGGAGLARLGGILVGTQADDR